MRKLTKISAVVTGVAMAGSLVACSGGGSGGNELTIWARPASVGSNVEELLAEEFPDYDITVSRINTIDDNLRSGLRTNSNLPDVAIIGGNLPEYFEVADQFLDMNEHGFTNEQEIVEWTLPAGQDADGRQVGLPTDIGPWGFFYRADKVEELGYPSDPDEFAAEVSTLEDYEEFAQAASDAGYLACDSPFSYFRLQLAQNHFMYFDFSDGEPKNVVDSPITEEAFMSSAALIEDGLCANVEPYSAEWNSAIAQDSLIAFPGPGYEEGILKPAAGEDTDVWRVAKTPGGAGAFTGSYATALATSENPDAAAEVAMFLASPEAMKAAYTEQGLFPGTAALYDDEELRAGDPFYGGQDAFGVFAEIAENAELARAAAGGSVIESEARIALQEIANRGLDPESTFRDFVEANSDVEG